MPIAPPCSPLIRPVVDRLMDSLRSGQLRSGDRLPSFRQLADQHQVSFAVARAAINHLERQGWVERFAGSGTYVRREPEVVGGLGVVDALRPADVYVFSVLRPHVGGALAEQLGVQMGLAGIPVIERGVWGVQFKKAMPQTADLWKVAPPRAVLLSFVEAGRDDMVRALAPPQTRVITMFRTGMWEPPRWHTANPDFYNAFLMGADHALRQGHRRIGVLTKQRMINANWRHTHRRRWMFETQQILGVGHAVREFGQGAALTIHTNTPVGGDPSGIPIDEANVAAMAAWLKDPKRPTAVIADDFRILGLLRAAGRLKLRVPDDLMVVGVGDSIVSRIAQFPCVDLRYDLLAQQIVGLIEISESQLGGAVRHITVPPRLLDENRNEMPLPDRLPMDRSLLRVAD